ncbi:MAG TPA: hypothetical protein VF791_05100 [Pyrinomonadaceae bacterium]
MRRRPYLALALALAAAAAFLLFVCQEQTTRDVLRISIPRNTTHMAVGQTSRLVAFEEYQDVKLNAASAASEHEISRASIMPKWSVSDPSVAVINEDGVIRALKPGRVTVQVHWEGFESSVTVEVLKDLPAGVLPQISADGVRCVPQGLSLSLNGERGLSFHLNFGDNGNCNDLTIEAPAPDKSLPWSFDHKGVRLELTSARGPIVGGTIQTPEGGRIVFTAWSEGAGTYPISLAGKTILLTGDSMSEGLGWEMKGKVEAAGGRLIVIPWYSSSTIGWQAEGRMKAYVEQHQPDIVFIALGSNEIFTTDLEARAKAVRAITSEIGDRPAYWIGPPSWKPDRGIVRVIQENFIPGRFYNSNDLRVPRRKDGAHPTVEGYATWVGLIWNWYARSI